MRPIKFRAWNPKEEYMHECVSVACSRENKWISMAVMKNGYIDSLSKDCIIMQFTGLADKNGKEIYIGDVVEIEGDMYEVTVNEIMQIPVIDSHRGQGKLYSLNKICKVVGNVYEMPDWDF